METAPQLTIKALMSREDTKVKFQEMLGKKAQGFITSVLQIVASNELLAKADPMSIYSSACMAAVLDLPINNNLGFAYIVPYNVTMQDRSKKVMAQFQLGYKGFIQLSQRSGKFQTMNSSDVREGEVKNHDRLTGIITFDWDQSPERHKKKIIGYVSYFKLLNGFEKLLYMTVEELTAHGKAYSQSFKKGYGLWVDKFDSMGHKTSVKLLLSRYAPLSIEMEQALKVDQAILLDEGKTIHYADVSDVPVDKERERIRILIEECDTLVKLEEYRSHVPEDMMTFWLEKKDFLTNKN